MRIVLKKKYLDNETLFGAVKVFLALTASFAALLLPDNASSFKQVRDFIAVTCNTMCKVILLILLHLKSTHGCENSLTRYLYDCGLAGSVYNSIGAV